MLKLTQEYLKECMDYNRETGVFVWRERPLNHFVSRNGAKAWNAKHLYKVAGTLNEGGYIKIRIKNKCFNAHKLAWLYEYGVTPSGFKITHVNGDKADNKIINLIVDK